MPTSPSADPKTPGAWQGSHWYANFEVTGMILPGKKSPRSKRESNPGPSALEADALTTRPTRRYLMCRQDRATNVEVWSRTGQDSLDCQIKRRKWGWLGQTLRTPLSSVVLHALWRNPQGFLLVGCLTFQQHASHLRGGSAQTSLRAATLRLKLRIKLSTSPSHSILTLGQPVTALTLERQAPGRVAGSMPILKSLV